MNSPEVIEFSWTTTEYEHRKKSADWYWALGLIIITGSVISFIRGNLLFGFFIILGGILIGILSTKKPDPVSVEITDEIISINKLIIKFTEIESFWMYRNPFGTRKLIFKTRKNFNTIISIPISEDISTSELRSFLSEKLEEKELKETFTDLLLERIGF